MIDDAIRVLGGGHHTLIEELIAKRDEAANNLRFERAASLQKRIEQVENIFVYLNVNRRQEKYLPPIFGDTQKR